MKRAVLRVETSGGPISPFDLEEVDITGVDELETRRLRGQKP